MSRQKKLYSVGDKSGTHRPGPVTESMNPLSGSEDTMDGEFLNRVRFDFFTFQLNYVNSLRIEYGKRLSLGFAFLSLLFVILLRRWRSFTNTEYLIVTF
jgi:hypothetical protein